MQEEVEPGPSYHHSGEDIEEWEHHQDEKEEDKIR